MNILVLSCGTRNKLISYFKETENGFDRVIVTDCSALAPALYEADNYYLVPCMTDPKYLSVIFDICLKEKINAVLPLQEDELFLLASSYEKFKSIGVIPIVSTKGSVELCRDKYAFYCHMRKNSLPVLPSYNNLHKFLNDLDAGKIDFPVFIKPIRGCGSVGIQKVDDIELLSVLCKYSPEDILIQQFAAEEEYGVDVYVDMVSHKPVSIFSKKKLRMRGGETEKSVSMKDEKLFSLIEHVVASLSLFGPIDIDVFRLDGNYYISEINPRFGGGYPHAYKCGINFPKMIVNNLAGNENPDTIGNYEEGVYMLKYSDLLTVRV